MPLSEALSNAIQIAEGLQEAHEKGIVHRDIKPHNVMLTAKGQLKIMDFGLASLAGRSKLTKSGTTLGTPAYMAPEQLEGREVDRRADIWALGCVLYEMLTQRTPFDADYEQAIAYGILNEEPEPVSAQRADAQPEVDRAIAKALAKDREQRYQHADDLLVDLRALAEKQESGRSPALSGRKTPTESEPSASEAGMQHAVAAIDDGTPANNLVPRRKLHLALTLAGGAFLFAAAVSFMYFSQAPIERPVRKWSFSPEALSAVPGSVAVSPNGRHIAYVSDPGVKRLWVRDIDRLEPRELAGTEGATGPFWSPDSRLIGFGAGREVKRISVQGSPAITLCELPGAFAGGSWSPDGESVVFSAGTPARIFEVPARGGQPKLLFEPEKTARGSGNLYPHFLPLEAGARSLLMTVGSRAASDIILKNLETGESLLLAEGEQYPVYSPSGHIVYQVQGSLWASPFALQALKPTGEAFPIVESGVFSSVATDGTLVSLLRGGGLEQLVWRDRTGEKLGEIGQPQEVTRSPVLSPDGRSVAVRATEDGDNDIWVHEVERPMKRRLTFDPAGDLRPQWSPSGREITFQSSRGGTYDIFRQATGGTAKAELLVGAEAGERPYGWSRDGNYLLYTAEAAGNGNRDLWYLKRKGNGEGFDSVPFLATPFKEDAPSLSPDGRLLAYCSDASGEDQVYVRPFPSGDGQWRVSANGGCQPRWSRDGKELFYVEGDTMTAVEVATSPSFAAVSTTTLFSDPYLSAENSNQVSYDVSADGRFVLVDSVESANGGQSSIDVVENWYEEFRDR